MMMYVLDEKQDSNTLLRLRGILGAPLALDTIGLGARRPSKGFGTLIGQYCGPQTARRGLAHFLALGLG